MTMKKIISLYIIFAFLLTSFAGCGKLKNIVGLSQPEAPIPPKVNKQFEASSEIDAKDLMKKESWKEWACRQWKDNKWKWIGGVVAVVGVGTSGVCYYRYRCRSYDEYLRIPSGLPSSVINEFLYLSGKYIELMAERLRLVAEIPRREDAIYAVEHQISSLLGEMYAVACPSLNT
jgi:hypothetical protein